LLNGLKQRTEAREKGSSPNFSKRTAKLKEIVSSFGRAGATLRATWPTGEQNYGR
jgi:hypothetical protein